MPDDRKLSFEEFRSLQLGWACWRSQRGMEWRLWPPLEPEPVEPDELLQERDRQRLLNEPRMIR